MYSVPRQSYEPTAVTIVRLVASYAQGLGRSPSNVRR